MASTENSRRPRYETRSQTLEGHSLPLQRPSIHLTYSSSSCQWPSFSNYFTIHHHFSISSGLQNMSRGVLAAVVSLSEHNWLKVWEFVQPEISSLHQYSNTSPHPPWCVNNHPLPPQLVEKFKEATFSKGSNVITTQHANIWFSALLNYTTIVFHICGNCPWTGSYSSPLVCEFNFRRK